MAGTLPFYEALGLEPRLALDPADLQKRFYERSRMWHPDKFSRAAASEQAQALEMTAVLNDAFRTLRDPVARAEYFLKQQGLEPSKDAPPELLEEVFELNMALEELRGGDDSVRPQLQQAGERFEAMLAASDASLAEVFTRHDAGPEETARGCRNEIRGILNRRRYVANLVREVEKELHVHSAN